MAGITACLKAKGVVDEMPYIVAGVHPDSIMGGPMRALHSKQVRLPALLSSCMCVCVRARRWGSAHPFSLTPRVQPLFAHWTFALRGTFHPPSICRADLQGLIAAAGAVQASEADLDGNTVRCAILCESESAGTAKSRVPSPTPVVPYKWFLDCVTSYTILPFAHTQANGKK